MNERLQLIRKNLHYHGLVVWRTRGFWLRALLCWMIGGAALLFDESTNFDWRLRVRGAHPTSTGIILVDVSEGEWAALDPESRNVLRPLKEVVTFTDAFFWNARAWDRLLTKVLSGNPSAVGVTFFFGEATRSSSFSPNVTSSMRQTFEDPKIIWAADVDSSGRVLLPAFAQTSNSNVGLRSVRSDDDGTARRFSSPSVQFPHMAVRLAELGKPSLGDHLEQKYSTPTLINYSGPAATSFQVISARDLVEGRMPPGIFKDRVVIIGSLSNSYEMMQTPLGRMSRVEILANVVDNILSKGNVRRLPTPVYLVLLAMMLIGSVWLLANYPQSVALVFLTVSTVLWASISAWSFDVAKIWLPVMSPLAQLTATALVFLSFQLARNERRTWRLQQEQKYLSEIEQLKTNFVSMMSHDLKTPIAKIQAICDRLLASSDPENPVTGDLKSLRRSSDDLHRYIQSILQVTKVEAKDFQVQKEVTDINEDIEKVIQRLAPLAQEKRIRLETELEPMFSIEVDTTLIQEVIHNLIENAIKYTPDGGTVRVVSTEMDDNVKVLIEDTGPGIDPEDQKEIWRKFTRGRKQNDHVRGSGLGLYLVKYFIELHGGHVFLESTVGLGTKVGFTIPIASLEAEATSPDMSHEPRVMDFGSRTSQDDFVRETQSLS